jgi:hypothetical protein
LACTDAEKKDGTEKTEVTSETSKDAKVDAKTKEEQVQDLLKKTKKEDIPAPSDVAAAPADV